MWPNSQKQVFGAALLSIPRYFPTAVSV